MPGKKCEFTCINCGVMACRNRDTEFPASCLTSSLTDEEIAEITDIYKNDEEINRIALASAEVEGGFYGKYTRVEEIMEFARRIGAKKIGIATCVGLMKESQIFAKILEKNGFKVYGVACKIGAVDKHDIGIENEYIREEGACICNPILQAKTLNKQKTDLNVVVGLCVGHDSMFYRYSKAITTTLITKDRLTGHNPAAALYTAHSYYKKLL